MFADIILILGHFIGPYLLFMSFFSYYLIKPFFSRSVLIKQKPELPLLFEVFPFKCVKTQ